MRVNDENGRYISGREKVDRHLRPSPPGWKRPKPKYGIPGTGESIFYRGRVRSPVLGNSLDGPAKAIKKSFWENPRSFFLAHPERVYSPVQNDLLPAIQIDTPLGKKQSTKTWSKTPACHL